MIIDGDKLVSNNGVYSNCIESDVQYLFDMYIYPTHLHGRNEVTIRYVNEPCLFYLLEGKNLKNLYSCLTKHKYKAFLKKVFYNGKLDEYSSYLIIRW